MNKIKLIYDVAQTMKNKESVNTNLKFNLTKNDEKVAAFDGEFNKCLCSYGKRPHGHMPHGHHGFHKEECRDFRNVKEEGYEVQKAPSKLKGAFSMMSVFFGLLDSLEVIENNDGSAIVKLTDKDINDDLRETIKEIKSKKMEMAEAYGHGPMNHMKDVENLEFSVEISINKAKEIEGISIEANGKNEKEELMKLNLNANFIW